MNDEINEFATKYIIDNFIDRPLGILLCFRCGFIYINIIF